jgi:hypothetical protein
MFKDFIVALSLANLTFITIWEEVFIDFYEGTYFVDFPDYNSLKAVMFNVLLLTLILWGAMRLLRKSTFLAAIDHSLEWSSQLTLL